MQMKITPNHLTIFRIVMVPLIALCISVDNVPANAEIRYSSATIIAFFLFLLAAASDWYDGYLARSTNNITPFGKVFDSIADKLLIGGCTLALAYAGRLGNGLIFPTLVILLREILVAGLREYMAKHNPTASHDMLSTTKWAKIKSATQMVAVGLLIISPALLYPYCGILGGLVLWVAAGLSAYTGWQYWLEARPAFTNKA